MRTSSRRSGAVRAGPPLKTDVIFLFTDGEEEGMLGASAFVAEHSWARDVRVAANFEARGNAGESELFETRRRGWLPWPAGSPMRDLRASSP